MLSFHLHYLFSFVACVFHLSVSLTRTRNVEFLHKTLWSWEHTIPFSGTWHRVCCISHRSDCLTAAAEKSLSWPYLNLLLFPHWVGMDFSKVGQQGTEQSRIKGIWNGAMGQGHPAGTKTIHRKNNPLHWSCFSLFYVFKSWLLLM